MRIHIFHKGRLKGVTMDFRDRMIDAVERGECSEADAYDYVRESLADRADQQRKEAKESGSDERPTTPSS